MSSDDHMREATKILKNQFEQEAANLGKTIDVLLTEKGFSANAIQNIKNGATRIEGFTWHHHQTLGNMQLVVQDINTAFKHNGWILIVGKIKELMKMRLFWDYGVMINEEIIDLSEKNIGYILPDSLRKIVQEYDGGMLKKDEEGSQHNAYIDVMNIGKISFQLKRHRVLENYSKSEFLNHFVLYMDNLPKGFLAVAHDAGDNLIILDLNQSTGSESVYYLLIEEAFSREELEAEGYSHVEVEEKLKQSLICVSDSFDDLMNSII